MKKSKKKVSVKNAKKPLLKRGNPPGKRVAASLSGHTTEAEAQRLLQPELAALTEEELLHINLNVPSVVATVLGLLPRLRALRPAIVRRLPDFDLVRFDKLESYVLALNGTHASYLAAKGVTPKLPALVTEALALREVLRAEAQSLLLRRHITAKQLRALSKKRGYLNLVNDLSVLLEALRAAAPRVQGRWGVSAAELERAAVLKVQILTLLKDRNEPSQASRATADARARAFTLLLRAYDDVRRAVHYLKWHDRTIDETAPPLRGAPGKKRKRRVGAEASSVG